MTMADIAMASTFFQHIYNDDYQYCHIMQTVVEKFPKVTAYINTLLADFKFWKDSYTFKRSEPKVGTPAYYTDMIEFWFGKTSEWNRHNTAPDPSKIFRWFKKDPVLDKTLTDKYQTEIEELTKGNREYMKEDHFGSLCYFLLGDQFARNVFRGKAEAFACAPRTESLAKEILDDPERYNKYKNYEKFFVVVVLMHSENKEDTARAITELEKVRDEHPETPGLSLMAKSAVDHHEVVSKYGRYPARNKPLGRENTPEEQEYIDAGKGF